MRSSWWAPILVLAAAASARDAGAADPPQPAPPAAVETGPQATELWTGNERAARGAKIRLAAALGSRRSGAPLAGQRVAFEVNGVAAGTATTDAKGHAHLEYVVPELALGRYAIRASFAGATVPGATGSLLAASAASSLEVVKAGTTIEIATWGEPPVLPKPGDTRHISGHLYDAVTQKGLTKRTVRLKVEGAPAGGAVTQSGTNGADGYFSIAYTVPNIAAYRVEVIFDGDAEHWPSTGTNPFGYAAKAAQKPLYTWLDPASLVGAYEVGQTIRVRVIAGGTPPSGPAQPPANPVRGMFAFVGLYEPTPEECVSATNGTTDANGVAIVPLALTGSAGLSYVGARAYDSYNGYRTMNADPRAPIIVTRTTATIDLTLPPDAAAGTAVPVTLTVKRATDGKPVDHPKIETPDGQHVEGDASGHASFSAKIPPDHALGPEELAFKVAGDDKVWPSKASGVVRIVARRLAR